MGRAIDADKLGEVKFHSLLYTHITPSDVEAESYKRGWNDAIDSIIENAPTIEPERKKGKWIRITQGAIPEIYMCPFCNRTLKDSSIDGLMQIRYPFCHCGADMRG